MSYSKQLLQAIADEVTALHPRTEKGKLTVGTNWALETTITRETSEWDGMGGHDYDSVQLFKGSNDVAFHLLCVKLQDGDTLRSTR